jgi:hypothetical protein
LSISLRDVGGSTGVLFSQFSAPSCVGIWNTEYVGIR